MPVTINTNPYNKAPLSVDCPDEKLFPIGLEIAGVTVWSSIPQPDKIVFSAVLTERHFGKNSSKPISDIEQLTAFSEGLAGAQEFFKGTAPYKPEGKFAKKFVLPLGERENSVAVEISTTKVKDHPVNGWRVRFDLNPRKLGLT